MSKPKSRDPRPFPVVGIGASAGGLEAISRLLQSLPLDTGMAFVVVQHLDPKRESLLPLILQKATKMPVAHAVDGGEILPDHVYVIPPNTHMCVKGNTLKLLPRPEGISAMSVNCFLASLAAERGNKAIAVILSGTASDGALGVKAIKSEGGVVFAQDELSAGHFGMPHSAAATGVVDFIFPPEKIAAEIVQISLHPALSPDPRSLLDDGKTLGAIFQLLRRGTGVDFSLYKPSTIRRRLMRRLMLHKVAKLEQYKEILEKDEDEIRALHDDLLIHVTHFFREPKAIAALRAKAFPRILKSQSTDGPIRVWVPGCSTGEEAYTLAISLLDYLGERNSMNPVQIFATDLSEVALQRARAGVYSEEIQHHVSPRLLRRFFTKVDRGYEVVKRVRDACVFARQDLTKDPPFANVDLISCCNVLIYLGPEVQKQILPMFHYALRPAGVLMLGNSETVGEFSDLFTPADKKARLYYKKSSPLRMQYSARVQRPAPLMLDLPKGKPASAPWPETDVQKVAERLLLARFAPACVVIGGDHTVLHFRGRISRYLEPVTGKADLSLLKMVPAHAAGAVSALIQKARKSDAPAFQLLDLGGGDGLKKEALVEAVPFRLPVSGDRYYIVLFGAGTSSTSEDFRPAGKAAMPAPPESPSLKRLKNELASTRGYLQTVVEEHEAVNEELKSANEEIISANEELQSTNEELEIAKEELQAANEELSTVNEELQTRNVDLGLLNNDLLNLIAAVHLPIIMVSNDLRIRRFSAMAEKVMNLIPGDVGRPIGDIKPVMALPNIEQIIHEVIETVTTKELSVRDLEKRSYALRIRPYKTTENKIEGAVLVFIDNDPIQRAGPVEGVSAFEAALEVGPPLVVLDAKLRVVTASRSTYQAFGLTPSAIGQSLFEIDGGVWDVPGLRGRLESLAAGGEAVRDAAGTVRGRELLFSAVRLKGGEKQPQLLLSIDSRA